MMASTPGLVQKLFGSFDAVVETFTPASTFPDPMASPWAILVVAACCSLWSQNTQILSEPPRAGGSAVVLLCRSQTPGSVFM